MVDSLSPFRTGRRFADHVSSAPHRNDSHGSRFSKGRIPRRAQFGPPVLRSSEAHSVNRSRSTDDLSTVYFIVGSGVPLRSIWFAKIYQAGFMEGVQRTNCLKPVLPLGALPLGTMTMGGAYVQWRALAKSRSGSPPQRIAGLPNGHCSARSSPEMRNVRRAGCIIRMAAEGYGVL